MCTGPGNDNFDDVAWEESFPDMETLRASAFDADSYDAIWLAAIGIATAAATKPIDTVTGSDVMRVIREGRLPQFMGAAGHRSFLPNGDVDLSKSLFEISNFGTPPGAASGRHAVVATLDITTKELVMVEGESIVWANGKIYPYVSAQTPPPPPLFPQFQLHKPLLLPAISSIFLDVITWHVRIAFRTGKYFVSTPAALSGPSALYIQNDIKLSGSELMPCRINVMNKTAIVCEAAFSIGTTAHTPCAVLTI